MPLNVSNRTSDELKLHSCLHMANGHYRYPRYKSLDSRMHARCAELSCVVQSGLSVDRLCSTSSNLREPFVQCTQLRSRARHNTSADVSV